MPRPLGHPVRIIVHHTVTPTDWSAARINELHRPRFGGIGYHALIRQAAGGDWIVEDGRDDDNMGAHTRGNNTGSLGVAIAGDYSAGPPAPGAIGMAIGQCLAWCLQYGIDPQEIHGHRHAPGGLTATVCPGQTPIDQIRAAVAAALAALRH